MPYRVFISHAGVDNFIAYELAENIKGRGAEVFLDELDIFAGDDIEAILLDNLKESNELWVLLTPNALDRSYVWLEVGVAWSRGIRIVGLLLGITRAEMLSEENIPMLLKRRQCVRYADEAEYERCLQALQGRIEDATGIVYRMLRRLRKMIRTDASA